MPTFYTGTRYILKPQEGDPTNTYTQRKGTYSNWALFSSTHVLDGAPDVAHTPGDGYSPGDIYLTRIYLGLEDNHRTLKVLSTYPRQDADFFRQVPLLWKGVTSTQVFFGSDYGHVEGGGPMAEYATDQINFKYHGVPSGQVMTGVGHAIRYWEESTVPSGFGRIRPYEYQGVPGAFQPDTGHEEYAASVIADSLADYGAIPAPRSSTMHYGFEHVMEWSGVPSAKAMDVTGTPKQPPRP